MKAVFFNLKTLLFSEKSKYSVLFKQKPETAPETHGGKRLLPTILIFLPVLTNSLCFAQGVGINVTGNPPHQSAILDVNSTDKGMLIPRVALQSPSNPISSPAEGLMVYNTSTSGAYPVPGFYYFNGTDWEAMNASASNSRTVFRNLTSEVTSTVTTSSAGITNLVGITNYIPLNDTILVSFSAAARVSACSGCTSSTHPLQKWGFRLRVNSINYKTAHSNPNGNILNADLHVSFTVPVPVTPGSPVSISVEISGFPTTAGTMTLRINPANTTEFANLIIYDIPTH